jgi:hypothetical protein
MNITFLVGNGFDLQMGLKTRYSDFVQIYKDLPSNAACVKEFKKDIASDLSTWTDAEIAFGQYTTKFNSDTAGDFRICYDDFCIELSGYLRKQVSDYDFTTYKDFIIPSIRNGIAKFPSLLLPQSESTINKHLIKLDQEERIYSFINFNYTDLLDRSVIIATSENRVIHSRKAGNNIIHDKIGNITHIHGTTHKHLILGVNDEDQIDNKELLKIRRITRSLLKPLSNEASHLGNANLCSQIIETSHMLIVFGMSLGITDKFWWQKIGGWLRNDTSRHLILYMFRWNYTDVIQSVYTDAEEEIEDNFFINASIADNEREAFRPRIHISINSNLFGDNPIELLSKK